MSNHRLPDSTDQEASRLLVENARALLDQLDLVGGRGPRAEIFGHCTPGYIGRMIPTAARSAGYDGHDDTERDRIGRERLFWEAEQYLLELGVLVDWSGTGEVLAIDYTNLVPLRAGDSIYVPGTTYRQNQREQALTELRTLLMPVRDQFTAAFGRVVALYREQIRRGQLKGAARDEAVDRLMQVAEVLVNRTIIEELRSPPVVITPTKGRKARKQDSQDVSLPSEDVSLPVEDVSPGSTLDSGGYIKRERQARGLTQVQLAEALGFSETVTVNAETGRRQLPPWRLEQFERWFREHPVENGTVS